MSTLMLNPLSLCCRVKAAAFIFSYKYVYLILAYLPERGLRGLMAEYE